MLSAVWDFELSGDEFDRRLAEHFRKHAEKHLGSELNPKALAKLLKEATRVKEILSANKETVAMVIWISKNSHPNIGGKSY